MLLWQRHAIDLLISKQLIFLREKVIFLKRNRVEVTHKSHKLNTLVRIQIPLLILKKIKRSFMNNTTINYIYLLFSLVIINQLIMYIVVITKLIEIELILKGKK
ncbi:MAG TPA: hypothetical protein DEG71_07095 [Clostridiales bacterium]|nr:hypothetical protein [Clostridiales bacterium]